MGGEALKKVERMGGIHQEASLEQKAIMVSLKEIHVILKAELLALFKASAETDFLALESEVYFSKLLLLKWQRVALFILLKYPELPSSRAVDLASEKMKDRVFFTLSEVKKALIYVEAALESEIKQTRHLIRRLAEGKSHFVDLPDLRPEPTVKREGEENIKLGILVRSQALAEKYAEAPEFLRAQINAALVKAMAKMHFPKERDYVMAYVEEQRDAEI